MSTARASLRSSGDLCESVCGKDLVQRQREKAKGNGGGGGKAVSMEAGRVKRMEGDTRYCCQNRMDMQTLTSPLLRSSDLQSPA